MPPLVPWENYLAEPVPVPPWNAGLRIADGEVRTALRLVLGLAVAGIPVGLFWLALAPRREYEVVDGGFRAVEPQSEALIGADGWLLIITGMLGVLAAGLVWRFVRVRGVGIVLGLALGMVVAAVVAWQIGEWLGTGPSEAQLTQLGQIVIPALQLRAIPVLVIGAFLATLTYLVVVCFAASDDLQRSRLAGFSSGSTEPPTAPRGPEPHADWPAPSIHGAADVTVPPTAPPSGLRPAAPVDPRP